MNPRLALALIVLATAPLAALAWLGVRLAEGEAAAVEERFEGVITARLDETRDTITRAVDGLEGDLLAATADLPADPTAVRAHLRDERRLSHLLVFDADGRLIHPPPEGDKSDAERALLERTRGIWQGRDFARAAHAESEGPAPSSWYIWYWGGGLNLLYRRALPDGRTVAVEVDRPRLLSTVISALPATEVQRAARGDAAPDPGERIALVDSSGRIVYQWGHFTPPDGVQPRLDRALAPPLEAWRLTWSGPPPPAPGRGGLYAGLAAVALALLGLALWFHRASTAELRRAARRVSFVNQVSHELKTPLTNIRMYAELLDDDLWDADDRTRRRLAVIVDESRRLSRLIANILTFARHQRERLTLRPTPERLDTIVDHVVEQFRPAFAHKQIEIELDLDAPDPARLDADAVGQILGNLLGNIEKYAAAGQHARITTRRDGDRLTLTVADRGPGVPARHRERIFEPFHRISDALTDGVAGTGIGLGIARALARLHGGDLVLAPSADTPGATFVVTLHAAREPAPGETP